MGLRFRLSRTLKRRPWFDDFKEEDIKYLYLIEKLNNSELTPAEFQGRALNTINSQYDYGWTLKAKHNGEMKPMVIVFGIKTADFIHIDDVVFMPWATVRNKLESVLKFLCVIKKQHILTMKNDYQESKFFHRLMDYKVIKQAGTIYTEEGRFPFYQTFVSRKDG